MVALSGRPLPNRGRVKRRDTTDRLTADETVALHARITEEASSLPRHAAREYVAAVLELHGTDVVKALRARRWIRSGRPPQQTWEYPTFVDRKVSTHE